MTESDCPTLCRVSQSALWTINHRNYMRTRPDTHTSLCGNSFYPWNSLEFPFQGMNPEKSQCLSGYCRKMCPRTLCHPLCFFYCHTYKGINPVTVQNLTLAILLYNSCAEVIQKCDKCSVWIQNNVNDYLVHGYISLS